LREYLLSSEDIRQFLLLQAEGLRDRILSRGGVKTMKEEHQNPYYGENEDFYTEEEIELLLEDDEISATEEAFMRGYIDS